MCICMYTVHTHARSTHTNTRTHTCTYPFMKQWRADVIFTSTRLLCIWNNVVWYWFFQALPDDHTMITNSIYNKQFADNYEHARWSARNQHRKTYDFLLLSRWAYVRTSNSIQDNLIAKGRYNTSFQSSALFDYFHNYFIFEMLKNTTVSDTTLYCSHNVRALIGSPYMHASHCRAYAL